MYVEKGKHVCIKVYGVYGGLEDNPVVIDRTPTM